MGAPGLRGFRYVWPILAGLAALLIGALAGLGWLRIAGWWLFVLGNLRAAWFDSRVGRWIMMMGYHFVGPAVLSLPEWLQPDWGEDKNG